MARFKVSKKFMEGPEFQLMIDTYGPFIDISESTEGWSELFLYRVLKFDILGTDPDAYYDLWFKTNRDGSIVIDRLSPEEVPPTHEQQEAEEIESINYDIDNARSKGFSVGKVSDGYHTFDELYAHRIALFKALCRALFARAVYDEDFPWKSKLHSDGTMYDGWFIAGIGSATGKQISYHIPISEWDEWCANTIPYAPVWDGHTSADVVKRLAEL